MQSKELFIRISKADEVTINQNEVLRYLGIKGGDINSDFLSLIDEAKILFNSVVCYKAVVAPFQIKKISEQILSLGFLETGSRCLKMNLDDAESGFVFAATLGVGVDRLIMKYSRIEPSKASVIDAIASASVEAFCDKINDEFADGRAVNHRYSPGYGDLPLENQPAILEYLDANRKLGIALSDNMFMTPTKTVTALFGVR